MVQVQVNKKGNPKFELTPDLVNATLCPNCGSPDTDETDTEIHCHTCGMGKYKDGKRHYG